jgi:hypothetical protein
MGPLIPDIGKIVTLLESLGFGAQPVDGDYVCVRSSPLPEVYERIEVVIVGRDRDAVIVAASIAVVKHARTQRRGLIRTTGIEGMYDDELSGRATFSTRDQWDGWLRRLGERAPSAVAQLAQSAGDELLRSTQADRTRARELISRFLPSMIANQRLAPRRVLSEEQSHLVDLLLARPQMIARGLERACEAAAAILVLSGSEDVRAAIDDRVVPISIPQRTLRMPESVLTAMSLVVDLILQRGLS